MKLSARNQFPGTVTKVTEGAVNGIVTLDVNGTPVTATISLAAIRELGINSVSEASALLGAGEGAVLIRTKLADTDVTVAAAERRSAE